MHIFFTFRLCTAAALQLSFLEHHFHSASLLCCAADSQSTLVVASSASNQEREKNACQNIPQNMTVLPPEDVEVMFMFRSV